jgi:hypothetical protein
MYAASEAQSIANGMTYDQVANLVGGPGTLLNTTAGSESAITADRRVTIVVDAEP